jgi:hypothetical protein
MTKEDIVEIIRLLRAEGKKGREIALALFHEGYEIDKVEDAFYLEEYVVSQQPFTSDIRELHVSDNPQQAGIGTALMLMEPRTLPSVIWDKRLNL